MKIGLDLRFIDNDLYSWFVLELIKNLINTDKKNNYILYTNRVLLTEKKPCITTKIVWIKNWTTGEQLKFYKILKKDKNDLVIFFNYYKPLMYKGEYYIIIQDLKYIYYTNFNSTIQKYKNIYLFEKNIKNASKIICFDTNTKDELIENYHIKEKEVIVLQGFFIKSSLISKEKEIDLKIDTKTKYQINGDFFVYSWWDWIEKNLEKLIYVFEKLNQKHNLNLLIIWDIISRNISLRKLVMECKMQDKIKFLWKINKEEKKHIYLQTKWVIFPSLYETFPFHLSEPLYFDIPILASNLENIKNIFWNTIKYFSPISKSSMINAMDSYLKITPKKIDYKKIREKYIAKNSVEFLLKIINL
jgi:glycosyltransferase involved in cell wall biosynthesis